MKGDERWRFAYNLETKRQSAQWVTKIWNQDHVDYFFFFDSQGIVHKKCVPPRSTVNTEFYNNVLDRFCKWIARVTPHSPRIHQI